jgi:polyisoprenoid-binding protein YceI
MRRLIVLGAGLLAAACSQPAGAPQTNTAPATPAANSATPAAPAAPQIQPAATTAPAGDYSQDPGLSSLTFKVNYMGLSNYIGRFTMFDVRAHLDPQRPSQSTLQVTIPSSALGLDNPPEGLVSELLGPSHFHQVQYPNITFTSTQIRMTSPTTADVTGNLTMHGVTRPVTLQVTFNGGQAGTQASPHARVGFSARGSLRRSQFGMTTGLPSGGTPGIADEVNFEIETQLTGPAYQQP